jgi:hypothetical protein
MVHRKPNLPEKICQSCGRPFAWRKKWERDWNEVRFCSERCRRSAKAAAPAAPKRS